ncbi:molybdenum cofactor guanylyltransferase [Halanaerobium hydrogeniformans]|uniref:Probable molybdenum cofactor guanylyltransferase n=1 Tax=Halanaerobium hydrogeniformans TaxID=656519 RepID=E4RMJ5_HALHG|nr:molybdenum cofactor guanylyltransferase [Halanaerobium hydrogeniformans]ADQ14526.1 molybdopterin-guanine dinucleotide biosynthesis protein A [Halanaerobium hydrogeniformans]
MTSSNAILLAGGESSRFGGNKALAEFNGRPLIELIYANLNDYFNQVIVIGDKKTYSFLKGAEIKADIIENKGPLAGLYTGLYYSNKDYNFLAACDMPFLNKSYFSFLESYFSSDNNNYQIIVSEYRSFLEPLAGYYHKNLLKLIEKKLKNDELRIKSIYQEADLKIVKEDILKEKFNLKKLLFNINYPEDKLKAEKILNKLKSEDDFSSV